MEILVAVAIDLVARDDVVSDIAAATKPAVAAGVGSGRASVVNMLVQDNLVGLVADPDGRCPVVETAHVAARRPVKVVDITTEVDVLAQRRVIAVITGITRRITDLDTIGGLGAVRNIGQAQHLVVGKPVHVIGRTHHHIGGAHAGSRRCNSIKADGKVTVVFRVGNDPVDRGENTVEADGAIAFVLVVNVAAVTLEQAARPPTAAGGTGDNRKVLVAKPEYTVVTAVAQALNRNHRVHHRLGEGDVPDAVALPERDHFSAAWSVVDAGTRVGSFTPVTSGISPPGRFAREGNCHTSDSTAGITPGPVILGHTVPIDPADVAVGGTGHGGGRVNTVGHRFRDVGRTAVVPIRALVQGKRAQAVTQSVAELINALAVA